MVLHSEAIDLLPIRTGGGRTNVPGLITAPIIPAGLKALLLKVVLMELCKEKYFSPIPAIHKQPCGTSKSNCLADTVVSF